MHKYYIKLMILVVIHMCHLNPVMKIKIKIKIKILWSVRGQGVIGC